MSINRKPMPNGRHSDTRERERREQQERDAQRLHASAAMIARNARNDARYGNQPCAQCEPGAPLFVNGLCTLCSDCRRAARITAPSASDENAMREFEIRERDAPAMV